jgi:hypothetical protein
MNIISKEYLYDEEIAQLAGMVEGSMNDGESGQGWIAENQE